MSNFTKKSFLVFAALQFASIAESGNNGKKKSATAAPVAAKAAPLDSRIADLERHKAESDRRLVDLEGQIKKINDASDARLRLQKMILIHTGVVATAAGAYALTKKDTQNAISSAFLTAYVQGLRWVGNKLAGQGS